jgi:hypothetical protein
MRACTLRILWLLAATQLAALGIPSTKAQESSQQPSVEIEGLNDRYSSCALVEFSVRNTSRQQLHLEVYAEEIKSNAWTYVDYPYDLTDPISLYVKRVMVNPNMTRAGSSVDVKYDRCLRPTFVKERKSAFVNAIKKKDEEAASPILQRVGVDVYVFDQGHIKSARHVWSKSFKRITEKQLKP